MGLKIEITLELECSRYLVNYKEKADQSTDSSSNSDKSCSPSVGKLLAELAADGLISTELDSSIDTSSPVSSGTFPEKPDDDQQNTMNMEEQLSQDLEDIYVHPFKEEEIDGITLYIYI